MTPDIPLALRTALESGKCVLFLGAGIGSSVKDPQGNPAPDGPQLARLLIDHFDLGDLEDASLPQVAQLAEIRKGRTELESFVADRLRDLDPDHDLCWLFSLRWKAIFTTNYDGAIQRGYEKLATPRQTPVSISATSDLAVPDPDFEVPIYHLHGSLFHGETAKIVITEDDYAQFREKRRMLFELLKIQFATSTILYIGYSNQDPNWRAVLTELRAEFAPSSPPPAFRIAPGTALVEREILRARGVETIDATLSAFVADMKAVIDESRLDASKIDSLRAKVPSDLVAQFDEAPAPMMRLLNSWEYVNEAPFDTPPNISSFLKGETANWALVANTLHFERDVESPLYDFLLDVITGTPGVATTLLLAPAGYGVTTILMSIAARLVKDKAGPVLMHRRGSPLVQGDILYATSLFETPAIVIVDNASDQKHELSQVIYRLKELKRPALFLLGERLNEWNQRSPRINGREHRIEPLSDPEILRLLSFLEDNGSLGELDHLASDMRVNAVKMKHENQLLVVMREVTEGKSFDAIIEDEYRGIDGESGRQLYATVCCAYQLRSYIRDGVLSEVLGLGLTALYDCTRESTEGIVEFDYEDSRRGFFAARARHHVIAQVVWERCVPSEEKSRIISSVLASLNLSYHTDVRLLEQFVRSDVVVDSIRGLEGKIRFFEGAAKKLPDNPYVHQHYARMLLREDKPELALAQIDLALSMDESIRVLHHTKGKVLANQAATIDSLEIARRRLVQAEAAFRRSKSMNERDPYPYQSLAELYLMWAKRVRDESESVDYITKAEEIIGEGLPKVWDREGLWIVSSSIQRWLGDRPEAIRALERAVSETPGSIVARYILGVRYLEQGDAHKAIETLKPLVSADPNEFRPCIAFARAQIASGETYKTAIASLRLGELFGFRDPAFIATLGGMQFADGQFSESEATFRRAAEREFSFAELSAVRFVPPESPGASRPLQLEGVVIAVHRGYAFLRTPGYPDVFCPGSKFGDTVMEPEMRVRYQLGFSARGAVALSVAPA